MSTEGKSLRRYNAQIERTLGTFDLSNEWADHIAFLSRLQKSLAIGKPEKLDDIPCKAQIALCLARCLQPNLPSGVHQKALEVYNEIFTTISNDRLAKDLSLYLPGLSSSLASANLVIRPLVLKLFKNRIFALSPRELRVALKVLILALLPVIEDETAEDFEVYLSLFDDLRLLYARNGEESFFWQTLFIAAISSPQKLPGVLVYLNRYLPVLTRAQHKTNNAQVEYQSFIDPEPGLLVRCFAAALEDDRLLVKRGFLELLLTRLPLDASIFTVPAYQKDLDVLMQAALLITLRRDMSLNRRLFSWLSGPSSKTIKPASSEMPDESISAGETKSFFEKYGYYSALRAILTLIKSSTLTPKSKARSFRILTALMDSAQIGPNLLIGSFRMLCESLREYKTIASNEAAFDEVLRSATLLIESIEADLMCKVLIQLLENDRLSLLSFVISTIDLAFVENAPDLLSALLQRLLKISDDCWSSTDTCDGFLLTLMTCVPRRDGHETEFQVLVEDTLNRLRSGMRSGLDQEVIDELVSCLKHLARTGYSLSLLSLAELAKDLQRRLYDMSPAAIEFQVVHTTVGVLSAVASTDIEYDDLTIKELHCLAKLTVESLWNCLDPKLPHLHLTTIDYLWTLQDYQILAGHINNVLSQMYLIALSIADRDDFVEKFGTLYIFSQGGRKRKDKFQTVLDKMFLQLLDDDNLSTPSSSFGKWLSTVTDIEPFFRIITHSEAVRQDDLILTMNRYYKLIDLIHVSDAQWRTIRRADFIAEVLDLCKRCVTDQSVSIHLGDQSLSLLRKLYDSSTGNPPSTGLIDFLVQELEKSLKDGRLQEQILDTLLALISPSSVMSNDSMNALLRGFSIVTADVRLRKWIDIICNCLPHQHWFLSSLLDTTQRFVGRLSELFEELKRVFESVGSSTDSPEAELCIARLIAGLQNVLIRAHKQADTSSVPSGIVGSAPADSTVSARARENNKLTVILCMQDACKICTDLWLWQRPSDKKNALTLDHKITAKSFDYVSIRLRRYARSFLESLVRRESQECLETIIQMWSRSRKSHVMKLANSLNCLAPKQIITMSLQASLLRLNAVAVVSLAKSTMTVEISPLELFEFCNAYLASLESDVLDEVWPEATTVLQELVTNPILPQELLIPLLEFVAGLATNMDSTALDSRTRSYRELADLTTRLFTTIFAVKSQDLPTDNQNTLITSRESNEGKGRIGVPIGSVVEALNHCFSLLTPMLRKFDKLNLICTGIMANIVTPQIHAKNFPHSLTPGLLQLVLLISRSNPSHKLWRKDVSECFHDPRLFNSKPDLIIGSWLPVFRQLTMTEKGLVAESLSKIPPTASAGLLMGIGAAAARREADTKTSQELKKITLLIMNMDDDWILPSLPQISLKIEDLLTTTMVSSPSLVSRSEVYKLLRALVLKVSHFNLFGLWATIGIELQALCKDVLMGSDGIYPPNAKLQGVKLLDLLLVLRPDGFQLYEWIYITDTIDAIYPPVDLQSTALGDKIASKLHVNGVILEASSNILMSSRKPHLCSEESRDESKIDALLAGFFDQLSIRAFEDLYTLQPVDMQACLHDCIADLLSTSET